MIHKTTRSILSVLLAALLLVTSVPLTPAFADGGAVSLQSESAEGRVLEGDGTKGDPYRISSAEELKNFAVAVNTGSEQSAHAVLMDDIDLSSVCSEENGTWTPIGNSIDNPYEGNFNGDGHTISGLTINDSTADYQGLFGYVSGTVQNLSVSGSVKGSGNRVGGVVGYNGGNVEECDFTGSVSGTDDYVGGVVGQNSGSVTNSYNTGTVSSNSNISEVGGVVGYNDGGRVENCYNTGKVSGPDSGTSNYVGGVVGWNSGSGSSGTVTVCYFLKTDDVNKDLQGIGNDASEPDATAVTSLDALCNAFNDTNTWTISENLNRPVLTSNHEDDGTQAHPYRISTATQLKNFATAVNGGEKSAHAKLMNNIDLKDVCGESNSWNPIGNDAHQYIGTFNGNGKTISGLYIYNSTADDQGLFGYVGTGGTVKDLTVSGSVSGNNYVGGIAGQNGGRITDCAFSGNVNVSDSYVGGVVGLNSGSVTNCYNIGDVSGIISAGGVVGQNSSTVENCYNIGKVRGYIYVGGVVGQNINGSITNCYYQKDKGAIVGIGDTTKDNSSQTEVKSLKDFQSGEVAYLLQGTQTTPVWGQSDLNTPDSWPTLIALDDSAQPVYKVTVVYGDYADAPKTETSYTNNPATPSETPSREGYTFDGWQKTTGEGNTITYTAKWTAIPATYTVTFDSQGGSAVSDQTVTEGRTITEPAAPTRDGHTFAGWFTESSGGSQWNFSTAVTENMTLYAQWTPHTYSITASPSALDFGSITEGEERPAAQTVTVKNTGNQAVTLNPPTATNFEIAKIDDLALDAGESVKLTIQPKDKLPRGSYSEQIVVSNTNDEKATITATFTVKEPPYTGKYSYELSTSVGDHGSLTVDRYATEGEKVTITISPDEAYKLDDLSVTAHGKDVELTANGDGTYTFTMPSADVKISATFAEDPDWTEPEEPTTDVSDLFIDIAPDAWYKDAVQYAYDNGLMTGVSATEFAPEQTTTRAMIVSILARLEGVTTAQAAGFADVDDEWYATAVNWAANVGVVNGYEDNTFKPNTAITREQLAAILMNYAAYKGEDVSNRADLTSYTDQPSTWAEEAMSWAVAEGLISGVTNDQLQPQSSATRAQVAAILQRFLEA